jgi:hypothetical protein
MKEQLEEEAGGLAFGIHTLISILVSPSLPLSLSLSLMHVQINVEMQLVI